ncbi:hypothetical protein [Nocardia barduliensis]|uniref:hypothetical protein n=1 Tax=Nocardia barduliensis TaxID=2736643 RepID=UPI001573682C|nr:hypothetical protein [Nocardia barduliensis]
MSINQQARAQFSITVRASCGGAAIREFHAVVAEIRATAWLLRWTSSMVNFTTRTRGCA